MDNITHSLTGLAVGELIHRSLPTEPDDVRNRLRRKLVLVTCFLASNFPDLDLFLTSLLPPPLGYLLHHRGHTHTLLYLLPQAILLLAVVWCLSPSARTALRQSAVVRKATFLSILLGFSLHLAMDYLNSYGIHPFHPIDSRWFYGDMVFIVEPYFWMTFGIPLAMTCKPRWMKTGLAVLLLGIPLYFMIGGYLAPISYGVLALIAVTLGRAQVKAGERGIGALVAAAVLAFVFVSVQSYSSWHAKRAVSSAARARDAVKTSDEPGRVLDSAMSPFPTNPFCWLFVTVEMNEQKGTYGSRRGILSLAPAFLKASECPAGLWGHNEQIEVTPAVVYFSEQHAAIGHLRHLAQTNCYFKAWLRFARVPWISENEAVDLRFSMRRPDANFTTMKINDHESRECPSPVPGWAFPREDLLTQEKSTASSTVNN